jgi:ATP-dependent DNA ligase
MFKPQKALHLYIEEQKKTPKYLNEGYALFEKYDGWYGYYDSVDKVIKSRAGRPIPSVAHLNELLEGHVVHGVLIFEILLTDVKEFSILNGILNRKEKASNAYLRVHDYFDYANPLAPLSKRLASAYQTVDAIKDKRVLQAPIIGISKSYNTWKDIADKVWATGAEGVILKRVNAPYEQDKRNYSLMKIKMEVTLDLLVIGVIRGEGKYEGTLGALRCVDSKGNVHTISGMTDQQRHDWWHKPSDIVNAVVEVQAMCVLPNGSLREPRFKAVRHDKAEKDID